MRNIADITWKDIKAEYKKTCNLSCIPTNLKILSSDYVFDESKSIKWNREQVELNNKAYDDETDRLIAKKSNAFKEVHNLILERIQYEVDYDISRRQAEVIWNYACSRECSSRIHNVYSHLIDIIDFINKLF